MAAEDFNHAILTHGRQMIFPFLRSGVRNPSVFTLRPHRTSNAVGTKDLTWFDSIEDSEPRRSTSR